MAIEPGRYKTRCGKVAVVFTVKARGSHPVVGVVRHASADEPASWDEYGKFFGESRESFWDLDEKIA